MPRHAGRLRICSTPGCPEYTAQGRCPDCRAAADQARGGARARGYGRAHEGFRAAVLARDPECVLCHNAPSVHADHWPIDRRELVRRGDDPNDPQHGRGLCQPCHSTETAREQPGGWNR
ncbi:holin [Streptomyces sp. DSM 41014]|uniref:Holin n=1 Tax=Streptomyces hintoniae TaxID=3075521 RepID=A0ABU2UX72_9ACTN|nr:holin [Streptomyces sp. DSM 41014]MDT0477387.1 holin [Streptomyces sp. DSM 41014]